MPITIEPLVAPLSDELRDLLSRADDTSLGLRIVADEKLFGRGRAGDPVSSLARLDGAPAGVITTCGPFVRVLAVDPRLRRRGVGSALLEAAEGELLHQRKTTITIGAEPGNYFVPGVIEGSDDTLSFFRHRGYTDRGEAVHLAAGAQASMAMPPLSNVTLSDATLDDAEPLSAFITSEFSGDWQFEVSRSFEHQPPPIVLAHRGKRIIGFAAWDTNNRGLGTFGPAGVAARERGTGTGRALLIAAVQRLAAAGYRRVIIQWAASLPFYERSVGARPLARFMLLRRTL